MLNRAQTALNNCLITTTTISDDSSSTSSSSSSSSSVPIYNFSMVFDNDNVGILMVVHGNSMNLLLHQQIFLKLMYNYMLVVNRLLTRIKYQYLHSVTIKDCLLKIVLLHEVFNLVVQELQNFIERKKNKNRLILDIV